MITMNEEQAVTKVVREIQQVAPEAELPPRRLQQGSHAEVAQALGARVIKQFPPRGYGPAMDLALRNRAG